MRCPNNSNSTQSGLSECPCDEGYYRTPQEVDLPCNSECNFSITESLLHVHTETRSKLISLESRPQRKAAWYLAIAEVLKFPEIWEFV